MHDRAGRYWPKTKLQELSTELSYWKGHGKGKEPVLKLGEKVQKMLNENPQFKRHPPLPK